MTAEIVILAEYRAERVENRRDDTELLRPRASRRDGLTASLSRKEQRWANHRAEPRHEMVGRCALKLTLNGKSAAIRNISRNGLMAEIGMEATPGSRLLAAFVGCQPLSARVIWKRNGLVGPEVPFGKIFP